MLGLIMCSIKAQAEFSIKSDSFENNKNIPIKFTCDGHDFSPEISWDNIPEGTKSIALLVDDPDAPTKEPFVHWIIYNIAPNQKNLNENIKNNLPEGIKQGSNHFKTIGYRGPCPPKGETHRYFFKLYALDIPVVSQKDNISKAEFLDIIKGHDLAQAQIIGTYKRKA